MTILRCSVACCLAWKAADFRLFPIIGRWHDSVKRHYPSVRDAYEAPSLVQALDVVSVFAKLNLSVERELLGVPLVDHPFTGLTKSTDITSHREVANAVEHRKRDRGP